MSEDRLDAVERTLNRAYSEITRDIAVSRNFTEEGVKLLVNQKVTLDTHAKILSDQDARLDRIETMLSQLLAHLKEMPSASPGAHEHADPESTQPEEAQPKRERTFFERLMGFYPDEAEVEKP
jgi:hypothetical protein